MVEIATVRERGTPEAVKVDNIQDRKKISSDIDARTKKEISNVKFSKLLESSSAFELGIGNRQEINRDNVASKNNCGKSESLGLTQPKFLRVSGEPQDKGRRIRTNPSPLANDISKIELSDSPLMFNRPKTTKTLIIRIVVTWGCELKNIIKRF